jgi:Flp pilus assembly pilin Flp
MRWLPRTAAISANFGVPAATRANGQRAAGLAWLLQTRRLRLDDFVRSSAMPIRIYRRFTAPRFTPQLSSRTSSYVAARPRSLAALFADTRGAVLVEYTILIGTLALAGIIGLIAIGIAVLNSFSFVLGLLLGAAP